MSRKFGLGLVSVAIVVGATAAGLTLTTRQQR